MSILKVSEVEKQTLKRSDKGFLFEPREIRVAYGEMYITNGHYADASKIKTGLKGSYEYKNDKVCMASDERECNTLESLKVWKDNWKRSEKETETDKDEDSSCYVSGNQEGTSPASALGRCPRGKPYTTAAAALTSTSKHVLKLFFLT